MGGEVVGRKQKRKYEKRKHKSGNNQYQVTTEIDVMDYGSTEEEPISPVSGVVAAASVMSCKLCVTCDVLLFTECDWVTGQVSV